MHKNEKFIMKKCSNNSKNKITKRETTPRTSIKQQQQQQRQ